MVVSFLNGFENTSAAVLKRYHNDNLNIKTWIRYSHDYKTRAINFNICKYQTLEFLNLRECEKFPAFKRRKLEIGCFKSEEGIRNLQKHFTSYVGEERIYLKISVWIFSLIICIVSACIEVNNLSSGY